MPLSPRLQTLLDATRAGHPVFDLCCDHGHLGVAALLSQRIPHVTFVDRVPAIVDTVSDRFPVALERTRATFLCADARELPPRPVTGSVIIAGVGGDVVRDILVGFALPSLQVGGRILVQAESKIDRVKTQLRSAVLDVQEREVVDNGTAFRLLFATKPAER